MLPAMPLVPQFLRKEKGRGKMGDGVIAWFGPTKSSLLFGIYRCNVSPRSLKMR